MPAIQLVLTGVPAFVGSVTGPTKVKFWIDENEFDQTKLIEVDVSKNTKSVPPARWATEVEVDQQVKDGFTTLGPKFHAGPHVGSVYLAERVFALHANGVLKNWPPAPDALYQYQAVLRNDGGTTTRYHGFKVQVMSPANGSQVHVAFIKLGTNGPAGGRAAARWIDLNDPDVCDPPSNGFTTISPTSSVGTDGALFLRTEVVAADGPSFPKIPRSAGW